MKKSIIIIIVCMLIIGLVLANEGNNIDILDIDMLNIGPLVPDENAPEYSDTTFMVKYKEGVDEETRAAMNELYGVEEVDVIGEGEDKVIVLKVKEGYSVEEAIENYENDENIDYSEPDYIMHFLYIPNDTYYNSQKAVLGIIKAPEAWDITKGSPVKVAVIDSGILKSHEDLATNIVSGYSAISSLNYWDIKLSHGTNVAGVLGAIGDNQKGVAGINWEAQIMAVKVDDASGKVVTSDVAKGIRWAADNGAKVINLSLMTATDNSTLKSAIDYAYGKGCVIVAGSGNDGKLGVGYPARYPNVIAVGAVAGDLVSRIAWSNYGPGLDVITPGSYYTTSSTGGYASVSGTSFASPQVVGLASLLLGIDPELTQQQIKKYIIDGCTDLGPEGWDEETGYGLINMAKSLQLLMESTGDTGNIQEVENIFSNTYEVEVENGASYIKEIEGTQVNSIEQKLNLPAYYKTEMKNISGQILTDTNLIGTGATIIIKKGNNEILKTYTAVVKGDITGEGEVNIFDIVRLTSYIFDESEGFIWNKAIEKAGKITESGGEPNIFDIVRLISYCFDGAGW